MLNRQGVSLNHSELGAPPIITRIATVADATAIARLQEAFSGLMVDPEDIVRHMDRCRQHEVMIVAEIESDVVGYAVLLVIPDAGDSDLYVQLGELYVVRECRHRGVGTALMQLAEQVVRERGGQCLILLTQFTNSVAQAFYRNLGYADYQLAMRRDLDQSPNGNRSTRQDDI